MSDTLTAGRIRRRVRKPLDPRWREAGLISFLSIGVAGYCIAARLKDYYYTRDAGFLACLGYSAYGLYKSVHNFVGTTLSMREQMYGDEDANPLHPSLQVTPDQSAARSLRAIAHSSFANAASGVWNEISWPAAEFSRKIQSLWLGHFPGGDGVGGAV